MHDVRCVALSAPSAGEQAAVLLYGQQGTGGGITQVREEGGSIPS
jgi:hypothetical protein